MNKSTINPNILPSSQTKRQRRVSIINLNADIIPLFRKKEEDCSVVDLIKHGLEDVVSKDKNQELVEKEKEIALKPLEMDNNSKEHISLPSSPLSELQPAEQLVKKEQELEETQKLKTEVRVQVDQEVAIDNIDLEFQPLVSPCKRTKSENESEFNNSFVLLTTELQVQIDLEVDNTDLEFQPLVSPRRRTKSETESGFNDSFVLLDQELEKEKQPQTPEPNSQVVEKECPSVEIVQNLKYDVFHQDEEPKRVEDNHHDDILAQPIINKQQSSCCDYDLGCEMACIIL